MRSNKYYYHILLWELHFLSDAHCKCIADIAGGYEIIDQLLYFGLAYRFT
jgi:hypothetical protein